MLRRASAHRSGPAFGRCVTCSRAPTVSTANPTPRARNEDVRSHQGWLGLDQVSVRWGLSWPGRGGRRRLRRNTARSGLSGESRRYRALAEPQTARSRGRSGPYRTPAMHCRTKPGAEGGSSPRLQRTPRQRRRERPRHSPTTNAEDGVPYRVHRVGASPSQAQRR